MRWLRSETAEDAQQRAQQRAVGPRKGRYGLVARIAGGGGKERHEHERVVERRARVLLVW